MSKENLLERGMCHMKRLSKKEIKDMKKTPNEYICEYMKEDSCLYDEKTGQILGQCILKEDICIDYLPQWPKGCSTYKNYKEITEGKTIPLEDNISF
jgi:hypothetical protein